MEDADPMFAAASRTAKCIPTYELIAWARGWISDNTITWDQDAMLHELVNRLERANHPAAVRRR